MRETIRAAPVHRSFDIDSRDPAFAPGNGTGVPGGLSMWQARAIVRGCAGQNLVGAYLIRASSPYDPSGYPGPIGADLLCEMLCVPASGRSAPA